MKNKYFLNQAIFGGLVLIFFLSRLYKINTLPLIYPDESTNYDIITSLFSGKPKMIGVYYLFYPHLPAFFLFSALGLRISPIKNIFSLRFLSVFWSGLAIIFVYLLSEEIFKKKIISIILSIILILDPFLIIFNRYCFVSNFYSFLVIFLLFLFIKYKKRELPEKILFPILGLVGVMLIGELYLWPYALMNLCFIILTKWERLKKPFLIKIIYIFLILMLAFLPLAFYIFWAVANFGKDIFLQRVIVLSLQRAGLSYSLWNIFFKGFGVIIRSVFDSFYLFLGLCYYIFPIFPKKIKEIPILTFIILISVGFISAYDSSLLQRIKVLYYPFLIFGFGGLIDWLFSNSFIFGKKEKKVYLELSAFLLLIIVQIFNFYTHLRTKSNPMDIYGVKQPKEAELVLSFLKKNHKNNKVTIIEPSISWAINFEKADLLQVLHYLGVDTTFYPLRLRNEKYFVYPLQLNNIDFVVLGEFSKKNWTIFQPGAKELIEFFQNNWPKVYTAGEYDVHKNPEI